MPESTMQTEQQQNTLTAKGTGLFVFVKEIQGTEPWKHLASLFVSLDFSSNRMNATTTTKPELVAF